MPFWIQKPRDCGVKHTGGIHSDWCKSNFIVEHKPVFDGEHRWAKWDRVKKMAACLACGFEARMLKGHTEENPAWPPIPNCPGKR